MRHHRLSASGLSRGRHCLHWARPDVAWPEREPDEYTLYGGAGHGVIDDTITSGERCDPLAYADRLDGAAAAKLEAVYESWLSWWTKARGDLQWKSEVRVAWNVATGEARFLPKTGEHRDYGDMDPNEIPGTADAYGVDDERLEIPDWKWGYMAVDPPATNIQLAFYGGAIASALGRDSARVTIVKPGEDAVFAYEPHELDVFSFAATREELRGMLARIANAEPNPGPWCDYCPLRAVCGTTVESVAQVVEASALVRKRPMSLEIQDNDHAAWMLTAIDSVNEFLKAARGKLREYADKHGGILLEDGTVWSAHSVHTEKPDLSVDGALQALYALGLIEAVESRTTWAAIKRAGGAKGEKAARERLKALGAIRATDHPRYEAKPVKKGRAA